MSILMFEDESIMLQEADFPDYYINKNHPDDFKPMHVPICELIYHRLQNHNRLILRISVKISDGMFIPLTFICDTGAPTHIYISDLTRRLINSRIEDDDLGNQLITVNGKRMIVNKSPELHRDTNIIGLLALTRFQMFFKDEGFGFNSLPEYF